MKKNKSKKCYNCKKKFPKHELGTFIWNGEVKAYFCHNEETNCAAITIEHFGNIIEKLTKNERTKIKLIKRT